VNDNRFCGKCQSFLLLGILARYLSLPASINEANQNNMNKVIEIPLKLGVNEYNVKLGAPRTLVKLFVRGRYIIRMAVDTSIDGAPCQFDVKQLNKESDLPYIGQFSDSMFLFSNCFSPMLPDE